MTARLRQRLLARLRLWSAMLADYSDGSHLDVSGQDALRARRESERRRS
jgi:hypothetical protein